MLVLYGVAYDLFSNLLLMLSIGVTGIYEIASVRHQIHEERLRHYTLSPGAQYRAHINDGGFRPC